MFPAIPIIDSHHHFWDLDTNYYPWLTDRLRQRRFGDYAAIRKNYLPEDLRADVGDLPLAGSVHVEASYGGSDPVDETSWLADQKARYGLPSAVVVHVDLCDAGVDDALARHVAAGPVRAVRVPLHWHPNPSLTGIPHDGQMQDPAWRAGLKHLTKFDLAFDLSVFHFQMEDALALARFAPDINFVLNHCGLPLHLDAAERPRDERAAWEAGIRTLAKAPNAYVKMSGLWMAGRKLSVDDIRPVVRHLVDCFGPERMMFGSNFPVDKLHVTYGDMVATYQAAVGDLTEAEKRRIFAGTAAEVYRLGPLLNRPAAAETALRTGGDRP